MANSLKNAIGVFDKTLGKNLKTLRMSAGMSQKELGVLLGVTFQQVQKYESGRNRLSSEGLFILKSYFDVPYDYFFEK